MGLDCSHDAFHGAYGAFNRFRQVVMQAWGGSWPPHTKPEYDAQRWYAPPGATQADFPGLWAFFNQDDCDGDLSPELCAHVADELEALLPTIAVTAPESWGHIAATGGYLVVTEKFIAGCRAAHAAGEPLRFE